MNNHDTQDVQNHELVSQGTKEHEPFEPNKDAAMEFDTKFKPGDPTAKFSLMGSKKAERLSVMQKQRLEHLEKSTFHKRQDRALITWKELCCYVPKT